MKFEPTVEWRNAEIGGFVNKVIVVLCKVAALILFVGMHSLLDFVLEKAFTNETHRLKELTEAATTVGFGFVYVAQIFDMIMLFLPNISFGSRPKEIAPSTEVAK